MSRPTTVSAPTVCAVVVNFADPEATLACVRSLQRSDRPVTIVVVDNGSGDDSVDQLSTAHPNIVIVESERNGGFAAGANHGIRHALAIGSELIWMLNNDVVIRPDALDRLLAAVRDHPEYDVFGCWIAWRDRPGELWYASAEYRWWRGLFRHVVAPQQEPGAQAIAVDWMSGCAMLVRASAFRRVGLLDEGFFMYGEDVDWQLRARTPPKALVVAAPLVTHQGGRTVSRLGPVAGRRFLLRSYLRLAAHHAGWALPLWMLHWLMEFFLKPAIRGDAASLAESFRACRRDPRTDEELRTLQRS